MTAGRRLTPPAKMTEDVLQTDSYQERRRVAAPQSEASAAASQGPSLGLASPPPSAGWEPASLEPQAGLGCGVGPPRDPGYSQCPQHRRSQCSLGRKQRIRRQRRRTCWRRLSSFAALSACRLQPFVVERSAQAQQVCMICGWIQHSSPYCALPVPVRLCHDPKANI